MSGFPSSYSPKSSPRGARSPVVSRQDSTGTLKTTISLGKNPSIVHSGPFYLMKEPPCKCHWNIEHVPFIFCTILCTMYEMYNTNKIILYNITHILMIIIIIIETYELVNMFLGNYY